MVAYNICNQCSHTHEESFCPRCYPPMLGRAGASLQPLTLSLEDAELMREYMKYKPHPLRFIYSRKKENNNPSRGIECGRKTKWRNPFKIDVKNRRKAFTLYKKCISTFPISQKSLTAWRDNGGDTAMLIALSGKVRPVLDPLKGRPLGCTCKLDQPCHVDILLELVNN